MNIDTHRACENNRPTLTGCVEGFMKRKAHIKVISLHAIEAFPTASVTSSAICEHISRMQASVHIYRINAPLRVFNIDESGVSFKYMIGRRRLLRTGPIQYKMIETVARTVGKLDHVTTMSVIGAIGRLYKQFVVFPGRGLHYRTVLWRRTTKPHWTPRLILLQARHRRC